MIKFLKILASLWLSLYVVAGVVGYSDEPRQEQRNKDIVHFEMLPYVQLVESFRQQHQRLPIEAEYDTLVVNHCQQLPRPPSPQDLKPMKFRDKVYACKGLAFVYARKESSLPKDSDFPSMEIDWKTNYVIAFWRGDGYQYYISQNDQYTIDDPGSGLWGLLGKWIIGLIPLTLIIGIQELFRGRFTKG